MTGIIRGLADNTANQVPSGLTIEITSSTNTVPGGWPIFGAADYSSGEGFTTSNGQITAANVEFLGQGNNYLYLGNTGDYYNELTDYNVTIDNASGNGPNSITFTPFNPSSVPGPVPLFGAGAAFGWSRRLRRRIKSPD